MGHSLMSYLVIRAQVAHQACRQLIERGLEAVVVRFLKGRAALGIIKHHRVQTPLQASRDQKGGVTHG